MYWEITNWKDPNFVSSKCLKLNLNIFQLLGKFEDFKDAAKARRQLLEDAKEFQIFKRDADELKAWLQEKIDSLKDEIGVSSNVEVTKLSIVLLNLDLF